MNNAEFGITVQKYICDKYRIPIPEKAYEQFNSNNNYKIIEQYHIDAVISLAFKEIGKTPVECLTYTASKNAGELYNPNNFILSNSKTLSIRTSGANSKIAPRVVGQAGIETFNYHFNQFLDKPIENKNEIKKVIFTHIHEMLPLFFDYLFTSDYTIWLQYHNDNNITATTFDRNNILNLEFDRQNFTFTRDLENWNESTTLKYKGISIAEIQIHKNRTFKFRFIMNSVITFLKSIFFTNETLGMTAEKTICDIFNLNYPNHLKKRSSKELQNEIQPIIIEAFKNLPKAILHTGSDSGERGKESKCSYDFLLEKNKTLSLKTNIGKMVCPPEVGQPSSSTCYIYFKDLCNSDEINEESFKKMVYENIDKMLHIYSEHLFDSDYLLWIYKKNEIFNYNIFEKNYASNFIWDKNKITFSKASILDWNESNTVKYDGISIGEFQVHKNRNCYKFRFNLYNLISLICK